jgi:mRNA interferase RelE/StbE
LTKYNVLLSKSATSQLSSLSKTLSERIKNSLKQLETDPFMSRSGSDIKKLKINKDTPLFRLRIGDYRVAYFVQEDRVLITKIFHRKKGYKWID